MVEGRPLGVEPICSVLQMAPSTYYAARDRVPSARSISDAVLVPELVRLWEDNYRVYGVRKLWKAARRAGIDIGRDQTGRLMRAAGIEGATRSRRVTTTKADPAAPRHTEKATACPPPRVSTPPRLRERQPLTAPSVMPAMNCLAPSAKMSSSGMTAMSDDDINMP